MVTPHSVPVASSHSSIAASPLPKGSVPSSSLSLKGGSSCDGRSGILPPQPPKPTKAPVTSLQLKQQQLPPTHPHSSAKRALPGTKKPRSKRIKPPDNRSTLTTTTDTAKTHVNVYDAVLGEAEDLLQAAFQAQSLGRLKMASAYQLLLHARLVGLGKRFDRATVVKVTPTIPESPDGSTTTTASTTAGTPSSSTSATLPTTGMSTPMAMSDAAPTTPGATMTTSVAELSKYLPSHIELDSTMMEHLARVAMELHHQKTGRKIHSDTPTPPPLSSSSKSTVAWTEAEKHQCQVLVDQGLTDYDISQRMKSRTEAQVRAYLQNQKIRQREVRAVEQDFGEEQSGNAASSTSPRKKGRGRKPPTQAMNTVPNANLDAKALLSGKGLG